MAYERTAAVAGLALIVLTAIVCAVITDVGWFKDVALVAAGGLAGVIYPAHGGNG